MRLNRSPFSGLRLRSPRALAPGGSLARLWGPDLVFLLLAALFSAVAALPLLGTYFVGSHDGVLAVYRFFEFDRSIQDGILIPRWAPDLFFGYGYPFFNFYAPLSYYVAEVFHLLGAGFVGSVSATFAAGFVLSGIAMYLFARDLGGRWAGLLASLAYVFAPYHLVNAHVRGDLAEFFAFVWFPVILWAAGRLISRGSLSYLALTSLFYAALLITHNIMALAFSPLLAAYVVFLLIRRRGSPGVPRRALLSTLAIVLAFGLTAFFWMPALQQVSEVQIGRLANDPSFYYRTSLMQISSYVSNGLLQGYGPRSADGHYGYPVELGLVQVLMAAAGVGILIWVWLRRRRADRQGLSRLAFFVVAGLVYYSIMFPWSLILWENVPLMSYLQSPWRLLPFLILFISVAIGYLGHQAALLDPRWKGPALSLLVILAVVPNVVELQPRYVDLRESDLSVNGMLRFEMLSQNLGMTAAGEYLPKGVRSKMTSSPLALESVSSGRPPALFDESFLSGGAQVDVIETRTILGRFRVQSAQGTPFLFNQTYFPGWTAYIDGREVTPRGAGTANLMAIDVPPGPHDVEFRFEDTKIRLLGKGVSLASLALLAGVLILAFRRRSATIEQESNNQPSSSTTRHNQVQLSTIKRYQALPLTVLALTVVATAASLAPQLHLSPPAAPFPVEAQWRNGPGLRGYDLGASVLRPGDELKVGILWSDPSGQEMKLGLKSHTGKVWAEVISSRLRGFDADPGQRYWRETTRLTLPGDLAPGVYYLTVDVLEGGKPLPLQEERLARPIFPEKSLLLGPITVDRPAPGQTAALSITNRRDADLEKKVAFLGYNLRTAERSLDLTTYWKALSIMREDYSIFAHLEDLNGKALTKNDLQPWASPYPTTLWKPGDVVAVPFHFDLPAGFNPENHQIGVGLYTPDNFQRLSLLDAAGHPVTNTLFLSLTPHR